MGPLSQKGPPKALGALGAWSSIIWGAEIGAVSVLLIWEFHSFCAATNDVIFESSRRYVLKRL